MRIENLLSCKVIEERTYGKSNVVFLDIVSLVCFLIFFVTRTFQCCLVVCSSDLCLQCTEYHIVFCFGINSVKSEL